MCFRFDAWQGVGFYFLISIFFWLNIPNRLIKGYSNMTASRIVKFQLYLTWFLMHSYYAGSMKMFFATDLTLPFDTLRDVLKDFPTWNLVYIYGNDIFFEVLASQVILIHTAFQGIKVGVSRLMLRLVPKTSKHCTTRLAQIST